MLKRTLSEHAAECFYGDEKLANLLWEHSRCQEDKQSINNWENLQEEFYHLLVEGVEARYPREHRLTDIRLLMGHMCAKNILQTPDLPWLHELQQRLLVRNGDFLSYHECEVQAYVRLAAGIDPTLLVGWHLALWLENSPQPNAHDIRRVVSVQTPFFAPQTNPSKPFAEGHVHFGGITADSVILGNHLLIGNKFTSSKKRGFWYKDQHSSLQLLIQRAQELLVRLIQYQQGSQQISEQLSIAINKPTFPLDWGLLSCIPESQIGSTEWLFNEFAHAMQYNSSNRWLWLYLYLCRSYRKPDTSPYVRTIVLCFWQTVNLIRRSLIMDGQGLTRFTERFYGATLRQGINDNHDNIRRLWSCVNDVAEIKSGPNAFSAKYIRSLTKAMAQNASLPLPSPPYIFGEDEICLDNKTKTYLQNLERWQFCAHFSRSGRHTRSRRHIPKLKEIWESADNLLVSLQSTSEWTAPEFLAGKLNSNFNFHPSRWFRGLDVAGDENVLKIEWFSPILRWLRNGLKLKSNGEPPSTGFHFSIHAGEDYAHPASGMRHIDETVRFCKMREGDRLGHALALGIEPKKWASRQGEMVLPLDEHLDNLVWLRHYAIILSAYLPLAHQVLPLINKRITRFWQESHWWHVPDLLEAESLSEKSVEPLCSSLRHATADDLFSAWQLRRNCYYHWQEQNIDWPLQARDIIALPDHEQLADKTNLATKIYLARHKWLATGKEDKLVIVRVGDEKRLANAHITNNHKSNFIEDIETIPELEFMHALQDWLLNEYDQLGLIIEANPTSNVCIARLQSHSEHPIFRWNPPDESILNPGESANLYGLRCGPMRVLVNTDDPGIMPTTLRTEYLLLKEAAMELKISRTVAECWLERLRQYSLEQFYRNHLPVFELNT